MENPDSRRTILLVDDQNVDLATLRSIFSDTYKTVCMTNGRDALVYLKSKDGGGVDVVITDLFMPIMDGYTLLNAIRSDKTLLDIPVFVVTEKGSSEQEQKLLNAGAWDFISKPYKAELLLVKVETALIKSQVGAGKKLNYMVKYDLLTGIYNKGRFLSETKLMLDTYPETSFDLVRLDIKSFKIVNSVFGVKAGDEALKNLGNKMSEFFDKIILCTYARIQADMFAFWPQL